MEKSVMNNWRARPQTKEQRKRSLMRAATTNANSKYAVTGKLKKRSPVSMGPLTAEQLKKL